MGIPSYIGTYPGRAPSQENWEISIFNKSSLENGRIFAPLTVSNAAHNISLSELAHMAVAFLTLIACQIKFFETIITEPINTHLDNLLI
jgi:hypothetical protein